MSLKTKRILYIILSLIIVLVFGAVLLSYTKPMEDISLNLSMMNDFDEEMAAPAKYDQKGWTVYTQEGEIRTELTPDGYGGFLGIKLGQTFYFSRVMEEVLDSPTLQLGAVNRKFSVWLDDDLIYTDCPELDNRIGYITLPMNEWDRTDKITISLPLDYQGKTLTIAQSSPNYTEAGSVKAFPTSVMLYCGYAYESELISESFSVAIICFAVFAVGLLLLVASIRNQDFSLLTLALAAFLWMAEQLSITSFYFKYFGFHNNSFVSAVDFFYTLALLIFLALKAGKGNKILWCMIGASALSTFSYAAALIIFPEFLANSFFSVFVTHTPAWFAFLTLLTILIMSFVRWRKEHAFYQIFCRAAVVSFVLYFTVQLLTYKFEVFFQIYANLTSLTCDYLYHRILEPTIAATLFTAIFTSVKAELTRRIEKRLLEEHRDLVLSSYENMRRQHEEVMMIRHDMMRHFHTLRDMSEEDAITNYLDDLIGQNEKVRPVVQSGNQMLDIILGSRLGAAANAGIDVEIIRAEAPEKLPLSDADLCSLVMNIMDNAITAASQFKAADPYIRVDIHVKNDFLIFVSENSADIQSIQENSKKETVPKHGLGLKIIKDIAERCEGLVDVEQGTDNYRIRVALPLL